MAAPYCGGLAITSMVWDGTQAMRVVFSSTYSSTYQYQLYVNRILSGITEATTDRYILANVIPADWPQEITILAVDPSLTATDYGADLPPRPYNQIKLTITPSGWTDAKYIEITSGTEAGGAVDTDNVLELVLFDTNRAYSFITDPLEGTGTWNFEIAGIDDAEPDGNRGTAQTAAVAIYAHPPDVEYQEDGTRFAVAVGATNITVSFTEAI